ncbi:MULTISPECIES: hypothetical protein [Clostridium]|jgi:hypothetical protein|uniref:hypothetical protein n=1 Tax=Clostridium TaxID=1485 RepID=UPI000E82BE12|nr:hypothetical protein [Clostridium tyrobutyricum]HBF76916.1 hypothetical protein [Clostridiaceae bacterium]
MYTDLGTNEIDTINERLEILYAMKKIQNIFGYCTPEQMDYAANEDDGSYSLVQIPQYCIFAKIKSNKVKLQLYAGDVELVQQMVSQLNKSTAALMLENICVEPIIINIKYRRELQDTINQKISSLIKVFQNGDPYKNDDITFDAFSTIIGIENGVVETELYFPCTISLSKNITDKIIKLFI